MTIRVTPFMANDDLYHGGVVAGGGLCHIYIGHETSITHSRPS